MVLPEPICMFVKDLLWHIWEPPKGRYCRFYVTSLHCSILLSVIAENYKLWLGGEGNLSSCTSIWLRTAVYECQTRSLAYNFTALYNRLLFLRFSVQSYGVYIQPQNVANLHTKLCLDFDLHLFFSPYTRIIKTQRDVWSKNYLESVQ